MRVQTLEALSAKIFLEFLALIVRNRIYSLLKDTLRKLNTRPNYMTVPAALRELEKIELVRRNNGIYRLDHAVSRRQKTILSAFGLDVDAVRAEAARIGRALAQNEKIIEEKEGE